MKTRTLDATEAKAFFANIEAQPLGARLIYNTTPTLGTRADGTKCFKFGEGLVNFDPGEAERFIDAGHIAIEVQELDPFDHPAFATWKIGADRVRASNRDLRGAPYVILDTSGYVGFNGNNAWGQYVTLIDQFATVGIVPHLGTIAAMFNSLLEANVPHPVIAGTIKAFVEGLKVSA